MKDIFQAAVSAIENDRREIGAEIALRLAAALGLSPEVVLYPGGFETKPPFYVIDLDGVPTPTRTAIYSLGNRVNGFRKLPRTVE